MQGFNEVVIGDDQDEARMSSLDFDVSWPLATGIDQRAPGNANALYL